MNAFARTAQHRDRRMHGFWQSALLTLMWLMTRSGALYRTARRRGQYTTSGFLGQFAHQAFAYSTRIMFLSPTHTIP